MMPKASVFVALAILVAASVALGVIGMGGQQKSPTNYGVLAAQVSIGPIHPTCLLGGTDTTPPLPTIELVVMSATAPNATVPVDWGYDNCNFVSNTRISLAPGSYELAFNTCVYIGCSRVFPAAFTITTNKTTSLQVIVDTGLR